ncbi:15265_t:CDS:10 [Cetraspora pellucida]|uniref:tRNA (guanine(10)-N(2))-methyltransferase n=1 Tax=Cetraspora pellucida TaxID=1433469 RepID=A0A9N9HTI8_9GLOM|nr:15265_t:CDS:10 [Cetraspora pellucida]
MKYFIQFAQFHEEFRLPELESLAKIEDVKLIYNKKEYKENCPFLVVNIETEEEAERLVKRAILIKNIYELWGMGETYDEVHAQVKASPERWYLYIHKSFKFTVSGFGSTCSSDYQVRIINSFSYLGFKGDINLKNPQVQFGVLEDYGLDSHAPIPPQIPYTIYFGRLASPGKLIYDPFVGTGSFLLTCAHFGAFTLGSDIDGRQIRGQANKSIKSNVDQYNLSDKVLDTLVSDIRHHPWRENLWFDAIVTDPPYGVRAGAKTLGRKDPTKRSRIINGVPAHKRENYYPPTKPYEMSEVLIDLLEFAARYLVVGGRLVYWLPTIVDEYSSTDIPIHPCMILISNSEQNFGQWSRRLITMEKFKENVEGEHANVNNAKSLDNMSLLFQKKKEGKSDKDEKDFGKMDDNDTNKKPGHYLFREKYFSFKSEEKTKREQTWIRFKNKDNTNDSIDHTQSSTSPTENLQCETSSDYNAEKPGQ